MQTSQISTASITTARNSAAWIDRSTHSMLKLTGADRVDLLHRLTTNDLRDLRPGFGKHTVLLTDKARIIDVIGVLHGEDCSYLICSAGHAFSVQQWLKKYIIMDDVSISDLSQSFDKVEICGPRSSEVVNSMFGHNCHSFAIDQWSTVNLDDDQVIITRQPSSCEVSYWIFAPTQAGQHIRASLESHAEVIPRLLEPDIEYVRILGGMGKLGHEWTDAYNPLEAGLLHYTSFAKGCYIGQEVVARLDSYNKVKQRVMGLTSDSPMHTGDKLLVDEQIIGVVTSVTPSSDCSSWFALGYVRGEHAHPDAPLQIMRDDILISVTQHLLPMEDTLCR